MKPEYSVEQLVPSDAQAVQPLQDGAANEAEQELDGAEQPNVAVQQQ